MYRHIDKLPADFIPCPTLNISSRELYHDVIMFSFLCSKKERPSNGCGSQSRRCTHTVPRHETLPTARRLHHLIIIVVHWDCFEYFQIEITVSNEKLKLTVALAVGLLPVDELGVVLASSLSKHDLLPSSSTLSWQHEAAAQAWIVFGSSYWTARKLFMKWCILR